MGQLELARSQPRHLDLGPDRPAPCVVEPSCTHGCVPGALLALGFTRQRHTIVSIAVWALVLAWGLARPSSAGALGLPRAAWLQETSAAELEDSVRPARLSFARLDLHGPIHALAIEFQGLGRTSVHAELSAGERLQAVVPVPIASSNLGAGAQFRIDSNETQQSPAGRAAFAEERSASGWPLDAIRFERERQERWRALPLELRARPRPPAGEDVGVQVPSSGLYLALATAVLFAGMRKRPVWAGAVCVLGAASIWYVASASSALSSAAAITQRCVIEHEFGTGHWLLVRSSRGELRLGAHSPVSIESDPVDAQVTCVVDARKPSSARVQGPALWTVVEAFDPRGGELQPGANTLFDLDRVWSRGQGAQGIASGWSNARQWPRGEAASPLPGVAQPPPGWLLRGLPLGRSACIGKLRSGPGLDQLLAQAGVLEPGEL